MEIREENTVTGIEHLKESLRGDLVSYIILAIKK